MYGETYKRKAKEYIKLLITKRKSKFELEGRKGAIRVIKWNLKARKERIDYLKSRIEELKKSIKQGMSDAMFILNNKRYKPKEFWVDSKYI